MSASSIEWTDATWNPVRGCSRVSEGCRNCYAERIAVRFSGPGKPYEGFADVPPGKRHSQTGTATCGVRGHWTGKVELIPEKLAEPLHWRKPRRVFVNSMSDLFHEALPDAAIDRVFAVMMVSYWNTFQVLTKRPERMLKYLSHARGPGNVLARVLTAAKALPFPRDYVHAEGFGWPYRNVWLGVSVEDQKTADARIPLLLQTPAAKRFISLEPQLAPVDLAAWLPICADCNRHRGKPTAPITHHHPPALDWVIQGGESGPGARPFDVEWARSTVRQCREAGVACFVKQLGARLITYVGGEDIELVAGWKHRRWHDPEFTDQRRQEIGLRSSKGGDMAEWPADLRVREFPA